MLYYIVACYSIVYYCLVYCISQINPRARLLRLQRQAAEAEVETGNKAKQYQHIKHIIQYDTIIKTIIQYKSINGQ